MLELGQAFVGLERIGEDCRTGQHMLSEFGLKRLLLGSRNDLHSNSAIAFAAAFQNAHHGGFVFATGPSDLAGANVLVHVARFSADEGFLCLDLTGQFVAVLFLMREPNPVKHKPRGFLADSQCSMDLPGRDAVLGIGDKPHCRQPLIQADRGVLKDGSDLDGKLPLWMMGTALPAELILQETDALAPTSRTFHHAIQPALFGQIFEAIFWAGKVEDGFVESADWRVFHAFSLSEKMDYASLLLPFTSAAFGRGWGGVERSRLT
jgi:hypothetical protein